MEAGIRSASASASASGTRTRTRTRTLSRRKPPRNQSHRHDIHCACACACACDMKRDCARPSLRRSRRRLRPGTVSGTMSVYCPILLALVLLSSSLFLPSACAAVTSVDALVECRSTLSRYYDSNNDGWLQKTEYIIFVQEQPTGCVFTDFSAVDATFTIFACPEDCVSTSSATATATAACCPGFRPTQLNLAEIDLMSFCVLVLSAIQADCGARTPTPATEPAIKAAAVLGPSTTTTAEQQQQQQQQQQAKGLQVYAIVLISFAGAMGLFIVYWFGLHHHPHHAHHSHGRRPNGGGGGGGGTTTIRKKKRPKPQDADSTGIRTPSTKGPSPQVSDSSHDDELQDLERLATLTTTTSMMRASNNTTYIPADMDEPIGVDREDETGPSPRVLSSSFGCHPLPSPTKNYINKKIKNHDIQNGNRNGKVAFRMDATGAITQVELSPCTTLTASASSSSYYSEDVEGGILVQCPPTTLLGCHPSQMERSSAASAKDHDDENQEHDDDDDHEHDHDDADAEDMMSSGTRSGTTTTIPYRQSPIAVRRKRQTDSGRYGDHRAVSSSGLVETIHADEDHSKGLGGERDRDGGAGDAEHVEKDPYAAFYDDHTTSKIASSGLIETDQTLKNDPYYGGVYYGENDDGEDDGGAMAAQMSRIATEDPLVTANGVPVYGGVYYGSDGEDDDDHDHDHEPQPSIDEEEEGFVADNLPEDGGANAPPTSSSEYNYYFAGIRRPTTPSGSIRSGRSRSSSQQQGQQPQQYHASPHSISTLGQNSAGMDQNSSAGGGGGGEDWSSANSRDSRRSWNSRDTVHSAEELEWQRRLRDDQLHSVTEEDTGALNTSMISQQQSQHQSTATSRTITTTNVGYTRRAP